MSEPDTSMRDTAARLLDGMAVEHWLLGGGDAPGLNPHRMYAMKLHDKADKLRRRILDNDL